LRYLPPGCGSKYRIVFELSPGSHRLSRRFRFYEKKRGHRRTVPQRFGSLGEALFFGFFLCVGAAALWAMLGLLIVP
jgi:hypothetical protein